MSYCYQNYLNCQIRKYAHQQPEPMLCTLKHDNTTLVLPFFDTCIYNNVCNIYKLDMVWHHYKTCRDDCDKAENKQLVLQRNALSWFIVRGNVTQHPCQSVDTVSECYWKQIMDMIQNNKRKCKKCIKESKYLCMWFPTKWFEASELQCRIDV